MSSSNSDVVAAHDAVNDPGIIWSLWRRGPMARAVLLLPVAVLVVLVLVLLQKPVHLYPVGADGSTWRADVKIALQERVSDGPLKPNGPLANLPGVGPIVSVNTNYAASGKKESVLFLTAVGLNQAGLAFLHGVTPPSDSCSIHLGGPWWQIGPLNTTTMKCAPGFHYTPGG